MMFSQETKMWLSFYGILNKHACQIWVAGKWNDQRPLVLWPGFQSCKRSPAIPASSCQLNSTPFQLECYSLFSQHDYPAVLTVQKNIYLSLIICMRNFETTGEGTFNKPILVTTLLQHTLKQF